MPTTTTSDTTLSRETLDMIDAFIQAWNAHEDLRQSDAGILERLVSRRRLDEMRLDVRAALGLLEEHPVPGRHAA